MAVPRKAVYHITINQDVLVLQSFLVKIGCALDPIGHKAFNVTVVRKIDAIAYSSLFFLLFFIKSYSKMGQVFSTSSTANQTPASTPQRAPNCADPRSPSRDIERTPITVNTSNDENSMATNSTTKPRKPSLRQTMLSRMMKNNAKPEDS